MILDCVHCELEWGEWGLCEDGKSYRSQFVAVEPVGAGDSCEDLTVEQKGKIQFFKAYVI